MENSHIVDDFRGLRPAAQIEALARLAHELTIVARDTYEVSSPDLRSPHRLRCLNEVQHRVTSHLLALLTGDPGRYPDEVLVSIILDQDDPELRRQVAFVRLGGLALHLVVVALQEIAKAIGHAFVDDFLPVLAQLSSEGNLDLLAERSLGTTRTGTHFHR